MSSLNLSGCPFERLVRERMVNVRLNKTGRLAIFKYSKRVFYDYLWHEGGAELLDARGIVLEVGSWKVVQRPFRKAFNFSELCVGVQNSLLDRPVVAPRKINGFMAAVSCHEEKLLVTTTGAFDSPFVDLAKKRLQNACMTNPFSYTRGHTYLFEICDPSDPHVIPELPGVYLIGKIENESGVMTSEKELDKEARHFVAFGFDVKRPAWSVMSVRDVLDLSAYADHEGFMARDLDTGEFLFKAKTKSYLARKLMIRGKFFLDPDRSGKRALLKKVEEEFYPLVDMIFDQIGIERWKEMSEKEKMERLTNELNLSRVMTHA